MNHSTVLKNLSSSVISDFPINARPLSIAQQSYRYVIFVVGTLTNLLVVVGIFHSRQLHYPRHVFWVAISLANQFQLFQAILEVVSIVNRNQLTCQIVVLNAGVFYTIVLTFLTLAAFDRYLAIARYEWYKKKVTNKNTIYLLAFGGLVTYLAATSPFWTGFKNIKNCTVNITHVHCVMIYNLLLGILCVVLHVMIFVRSREATNQHPNFLQASVALRFFPAPSSNIFSGAEHGIPQPVDQENPVITTRIDQVTDLDMNGTDAKCFAWLTNKKKLNRLEIRAALNMSINVLPVWLCTFPVTLNAIIIFWCIRLEKSCSINFRINPYLTDFFLCHTIYNPLMYMLTSTEFKRALARIKQKVKCK
ncbi:hypothetical protein GHT06_020736 [Daphnia sinensis]|uniref:G-protein coupled receptors family 1 profile domain-containing protein n=1 Tax=Daphnia sinensis TaxID=1820382 RepID=A0AAD5PPD7_9CRUS|nr:hypothetical protein GHT06_020736 [Daphnia sinensis]